MKPGKREQARSKAPGHRRRRLVGGAALLFTLATGLPGAYAAVPSSGPPSSIIVYAPFCPSSPVSFVSFVDSLRVELAGGGAKCCEIGVNERAATTEDAVRVTLSVAPCAATTLSITIDVTRVARGQALGNVLSFADIAPTARPRALSLEVAELVRALGREPASGPAPANLPSADATATTVPVVSSQSPATLDRESVRLSVSGEAELRIYAAPSTLFWGGRIALGFARQRLHGTLDVGGLFHRAHLDAGDVTIRAPFAGLTLGPAFTVGTFVLQMGVRGEVGWATVAGLPSASAGDVQAGQGSRVVVALGARAVLQGGAWQTLRGRLALEAGAALRSVTANVNGESVSALRGPYLLLNLGFVY